MRPNRRAIDEREPRVIPGAFGYDQKQQVQAFLRRADKHFLDGTGHYAGHLRIHVEEEYGYRDWLWTYPGTVKQLVEDWKAGRRPISPTRRVAIGHHAYTGRGWFDGEFDEIYFDRDYYIGADGEEHIQSWPCLVETRAMLRFPKRGLTGHNRVDHGFDGFAHVHEENDSFLRIGYYEAKGLEEVEVHIEVLDALADIL